MTIDLRTPLLAATFVALALPAMAESTPSPEGAEAYIINLSDGDTLSSPVTVQFGLRGMGVAPAGVERPNTGHHHLLVNKDAAEVDLEDAVPADDNHIHFGGGQTETSLELPPGEYRLQLLLGDHDHIPHDPPVISAPVTITVK